MDNYLKQIAKEVTSEKFKNWYREAMRLAGARVTDKKRLRKNYKDYGK